MAVVVVMVVVVVIVVVAEPPKKNHRIKVALNPLRTKFHLALLIIFQKLKIRVRF